MNPFRELITVVLWVAQRLREVADSCYETFWIPDILGWWFDRLYDASTEAYGWLLHLAYWYEQIREQVEHIFTWEYWVGLWQSWTGYLEQLWNWFLDWINRVREVVTEWWQDISGTVLEWIDTISSGLDWLRGQVEQFFTVTLPELVHWNDLQAWWQGLTGDIQSLIDSAFSQRSGLWAGWQDFAESVSQFFSDPMDFLLDHFADWFLGKGEDDESSRQT